MACRTKSADGRIVRQRLSGFFMVLSLLLRCAASTDAASRRLRMCRTSPSTAWKMIGSLAPPVNTSNILTGGFVWHRREHERPTTRKHENDRKRGDFRRFVLSYFRDLVRNQFDPSRLPRFRHVQASTPSRPAANRANVTVATKLDMQFITPNKAMQSSNRNVRGRGSIARMRNVGYS